MVVAGVLEDRTERSARVDLPGGPLQVWVQALSLVFHYVKMPLVSGVSVLDGETGC